MQQDTPFSHESQAKKFTILYSDTCGILLNESEFVVKCYLFLCMIAGRKEPIYTEDLAETLDTSKRQAKLGLQRLQHIGLLQKNPTGFNMLAPHEDGFGVVTEDR